ncbi:energy transducer TonB [Tenacibaculum sp. HL-MS23]|uniref:energy transducer TonB n=1 Tax=Tenacibaculum sp. HL-MS23 TaxID=3077734 RepID=UPI0028FC26F3|nr:energy transducer TonB [Tenacibaculum sp. HL-MS23]WNW01440.1 energy transducer TonB [Tenacibaculum sp. HL-MS23]
MKKIIIIALFNLCVQQLFSQELCVVEEKMLIDVNALDNNKCEISENKPKVKTTKDIQMSSRRYLKKRVYLNQTVYSASNLQSKAVVNITAVNKVDDKLLAVLIKEPIVEEVSFDVVETIPLFISCKESDLNKVDCFNYQMQKHLIDNFIYPKKALEKEIEGNLEVSFIINANGIVSKVEVKGADNSGLLKKEAQRIVLLLPNFIPGEHKGRKISVSYKFPINFTLD